VTRRQRRGGDPNLRPDRPQRRSGHSPDADIETLVAGLRAGLTAQGILAGEAPAALAERLAAYLALLVRWNATYNLTAVRDPVEMIPRHVLDSLAVAPWLAGPRIVDVGTGAGLPGIPLALLRPGDSFTLVDSAGKRTRFLRHAVARLGLDNVEIVDARVQDYDGGSGFDTVVSRAFAAVADFVAAAGHLRRPGGHLLAMKGALPADELRVLPTGWRIEAIGRLAVPGLKAERHAVLLAGPEEDGVR
jgi:16S rRNA (guanine527-N7)-methyltransferase